MKNTYNGFIQAVRLYHEDINKFKVEYRKDMRLTRNEKKILECWELNRRKKYNDILNILTSDKFHGDDFFNANRDLILGIAYNNQNQYEKAKELCEHSFHYFKNETHYSLTFLAGYNLCMIAFNLNLQQVYKETIGVLNHLKNLNSTQLIRLSLASFSYAILKGSHQESDEILEELQKKASLMDEACFANFQIAKMLFYTSHKDYIRAQKTLGDFKKIRVYISSAHYKYFSILLNYLTKDKPLYFYDRDFKHHTFLKLQLEVIQCLQQQQVSPAKTLWEKLDILSPKTYDPNFKYSGPPSIFSFSLEKALTALTKISSIPLNSIDSHTNINKKMIQILKHASNPIHKEDLYNLVWGRALNSKEDLSKLSQLISKLRKKGFEISYSQNCYQLINHHHKKKVS